MISVYKLKPKFQQLITPILTLLYRLGVTANQITIIAIIFSFLIGIGFWFASDISILFLFLPVGLFIRMVLNALDGMMARKYNQASKLGEILNEMGDIVSDIVIFFPLIKFHSDHIYLIVIFIVLSIINEFAGVLGKVIGNDRRYDGPMGKSDRALLMGVYGVVMFFEINLLNSIEYILWIVNLMLVLSTYIRLKKGFYGY